MIKFKNIVKTFICTGLFLINVSYAAGLTYDPTELQAFINTNKCISCDLSGAILYTGNYSQAVLTNTNMSNASFQSLNLSQADLTNTNLTKASLNGDNFSEADFTGASLFQAVLDNTNLYMATITAAQLAQVASICNAILPDGSKGQC